MARAFILVMDSFGIGAAPDAARFGDAGADTLGHIAEHRLTEGRPLALPELAIRCQIAPCGSADCAESILAWSSTTDRLKAKLNWGLFIPLSLYELPNCLPIYPTNLFFALILIWEH